MEYISTILIIYRAAIGPTVGGLSAQALGVGPSYVAVGFSSFSLVRLSSLLVLYLREQYSLLRLYSLQSKLSGKCEIGQI